MKTRKVLISLSWVVFFFSPLCIALSHFFSPYGGILTLLKYLGVCFFSMLLLFYKGALRIPLGAIPVLIYAIWVVGLTVSSPSFVQADQVVRFQVIPIVMCLLVILAVRLSEEELVGVVDRSAHFMVIVLWLSIIVGLVEIVYQPILTIIYKMSIEQLGHAQTAIGRRLLSIYLNPINFGAALCLGVVAWSYIIPVRGWFKQSIFWGGVLVCLVMVALTLSRTSLLTCLIVVFFISMARYGFKAFKYWVLLSGIFVSVFLYYVASFLSLDEVLQRFSVLTSLSTYLENERVHNWSSGVSRIDSGFDLLFGLGAGVSNPDGHMAVSHGTIIVENAFLSNFFDFGLLGAFLYVCVHCRYVYLAFRLRVRKAMIFFVFFYVGYLFFCLTNDFNRNQPFSFYFWFFMGMLEAFSVSKKAGAYCEYTVLSPGASITSRVGRI